jgi:uncharacterized DUF497 family protein
MRYEYDLNKSLVNKQKHGLDFEEAQALWLDNDRIEMSANSKTEPRYAVIGSMFGAVWVAFCTDREGGIRIISVRRARKVEEELYEYEKKRHR